MSNQPINRQHINLLDSFRCLAIIPVMLFHFNDPFINRLADKAIFQHFFRFGYLGVELFFVISGFVISYTLEATPNIGIFWRNRFSRLFPPMLLCSLLTLGIVCCLDDQHIFPSAHEAKNLIPGFIFLNPSLPNLIQGVNLHWINGSYWTLWVEMQFYIISSILFFLNKKHFVRNLLIAGLLISADKYLPIVIPDIWPALLHVDHVKTVADVWRRGNEIFNITFFIPWFLAGVAFYQLYKGVEKSGRIFVPVISLLVVSSLFFDINQFFNTVFWQMTIAAVMIFSLFLLMIYRRGSLAFLENRVMMRIGVISYTMYLIHQVIGGLLMLKYGQCRGPWALIAPIVITILVIIFAELSYRYYEKPISNLLKRKRN